MTKIGVCLKTPLYSLFSFSLSLSLDSLFHNGEERNDVVSAQIMVSRIGSHKDNNPDLSRPPCWEMLPSILISMREVLMEPFIIPAYANRDQPLFIGTYCACNCVTHYF